MLNLEFVDAKFIQGQNVTIRNGDKWLRNFINGETTVKLVGIPENNRISEATIDKVYYLPFRAILDKWLNLHHSGSKSIFELFHTMTDIYKEFTWDNDVSVVFFTPKV
jgi:hypothetical protein